MPKSSFVYRVCLAGLVPFMVIGEDLARFRHVEPLLRATDIAGEKSPGSDAAQAVSTFGALASMFRLQGDPSLSQDVGRPAGPHAFVYPPARRADVVDDLHGVKVADPYRWLEQNDSGETKSWIDAQNQLTFGYLRSLSNRDAIRPTVARMYQGVWYGPAYAFGGNLFYRRLEQGQDKPVLWVRDRNGKKRVLLDPASLSTDGSVTVGMWQPSHDGKWVVYGTSTAGSDWQTLRIRSVETGADLVDTIEWVKFTQPAWLPDDSGFIYGRYPQPRESTYTQSNSHQKLYRHRLKTKQSSDQFIYERPDEPACVFKVDVVGGRYLVISTSTGASQDNQVHYRDLNDRDGSIRPLISEFEASYIVLGARGSNLLFQTTKAAPNGRIVSIDLETSDRGNWREVVSEQKTALSQALLAGDAIILNYVKDAASSLRIHNLADGSEKEISLPDMGSCVLPRVSQDDKIRYTLAGFTRPPMLYEFDDASGRSIGFEEGRSPLNLATYETRQVFYTSKDGTRIPMFLVHRKGLIANGSHPTLLYGYGGFNVPMQPGFHPLFGAWLELGGVVAVANIRGGGEYGREWHEAGIKLRKQNTFDDFIGAAVWLIANKITTSKKLAINGDSNGGLLVGACLNQRPELFGAAVPAVGVMDMLRFHKFTIGAAWVSDYGSPDNPEEFKALYAYSPLHNVRSVAYPSTLILTSDHDDRVVPAHSFKYAAAMQHAQKGTAPVLIRIETSAGHGQGESVSKYIEQQTDVLAFLMRSLNFRPPNKGSESSDQDQTGR